MKRIDAVIVWLIAFTIIALLAKDNILKKSIVISPAAISQYDIYNDQNSGGNSFVQYTSNQKKSFDWQCNIRSSSFEHPFCTFEAVLGKDREQGIDLSEFSKIKLWLTYKGDNTSVRLYLRHFDKEYSQVTDYTSTKYNAIDINTEYLTPGLEIDLNSFHVASWWQLERNLAPNLMAPEFTNIVTFDIQTGTNAVDGVHHFHLEKVVLIGQWLSTERWYLFILIIWLITVSSRLISHQVKLIKRIKTGKVRENELKEINSQLDKKGQMLQQAMYIDKLTGTYNRSGAELKLAEVLKTKNNLGQPCSIILLDIDHFKLINDTYGHDGGDKILKAFSYLIMQQIKTTDYFARWGGEEFMLICPNSSIIAAHTIAEKLRHIIASTPLTSNVNITASMGVAEITGQQDSAIDTAFKEADKALYRAKHLGRNRVEFAEAMA